MDASEPGAPRGFLAHTRRRMRDGALGARPDGLSMPARRWGRNGAGWMMVDGSTGQAVSAGSASNSARALATLVEPAWPVRLRTQGRDAEVATAFGPSGATVAALLDQMASTRWFSRCGRSPAPVEQRALNEVAMAFSPRQVGWLPSWEAASSLVDRLDPRPIRKAHDLRLAAQRAALRAGLGEELEAALRICGLIVDQRTTPTRDTADRIGMKASGAAVFWLTGLVAATVAGVDAGPLEAAGQLLLWGRWPLGADGDAWWAL
jgi:hypothetical protein